MKKIGESAITEAMVMDTRAKESGRKIYNLAAGDPNLPLQAELKNAFRNTDPDKTHQYSSSQGLPALRAKLNPGAPANVIISNGAKQLLYMSLKAVTDPGDNVVLIGPCWSSYMEICKLLKLNYSLVTGSEENRYVPDIDSIRKQMNGSICAIVLNTPNNPTGAVYSQEMLESIMELADEYDCWIISDEIYSNLVYNYPAPSLKGRLGVIYINGFSKSYSLTGWRLGYAISEPEIIRQMVSIQSQMSGPPSTLIQNIILDCFDDLKFDFEPYKKRIEMLCKNEKFARFKPEGGFYFYLPIGKNSKAFCESLLDEKGICITPGDGYGIPDTIRISVANIKTDELAKIQDTLFERI